jgi:hypothetical protein
VSYSQTKKDFLTSWPALWGRLSAARALQIFQLLRQGGVIAIAVLLAHSALSKDEIGVYEMLLYLGFLLTSFWVNGGIQGMLSLYPRLSEDEQARLLGQSWLLFGLLAVGVALLCWRSPTWLLGAFLQREELPYLPLFGLFLLGNTIASLQEYFYLLRRQVRAIVAYGLLSSVGQLLAVIVPVYWGYGLGGAVGSLTIVGIAKAAWSLAYVWHHGRWGWSAALARRWWQISWPLALYTLLGVLNQSIGPWLVSFLFAGDSAAFAIYRYGARELPLLGALVGALSSAFIPTIAARHATGLAELRRETERLGNWIFPISIILLLTSQWWFVALFAPKFAPSIPLFVTFLLTTPLHFVFARTLLIALADTRMIPFFAAAGLGLHLLLGSYLGSRYGMLGIAAASVLSFGAEKLALVFYLWRRHGIAWSSYTRLDWLLMWTVLLLVAYLAWMWW